MNIADNINVENREFIFDDDCECCQIKKRFIILYYLACTLGDESVAKELERLHDEGLDVDKLSLQETEIINMIYRNKKIINKKVI